MTVKLIDITDRVFGGKELIFAPINEGTVDFHVITVSGSDGYGRDDKVKSIVQAAIDNYGVEGLKVVAGTRFKECIDRITPGTRVAILHLSDSFDVTKPTPEEVTLLDLLRPIANTQSEKGCKKIIVIFSSSNPDYFHIKVREITSMKCYCNHMRDSHEVHTLPMMYQNYLRSINDSVRVYNDKSALDTMVVHLKTWASDHVPESVLNDPERTPLGFVRTPQGKCVCTSCGNIAVKRDLNYTKDHGLQCNKCYGYGIEDALVVDGKHVPCTDIVEVLE